jgi:hypothetical protein
MYHCTPQGLEEALMLLYSLESATASEPDIASKTNYADFLAMKGLGAASICGSDAMSGEEPPFDKVVQVWHDFLASE